ncbi:hypothetical protein ACR6C2_35935 [Streptomyces sp. INA 01156]
MRLYQHSLGLSREPGQLLSAVREIAGRQAAPVPPPDRSPAARGSRGETVAGGSGELPAQLVGLTPRSLEAR